MCIVDLPSSADTPSTVDSPYPAVTPEQPQQPVYAGTPQQQQQQQQADSVTAALTDVPVPAALSAGHDAAAVNADNDDDDDIERIGSLRIERRAAATGGVYGSVVSVGAMKAGSADAHPLGDGAADGDADA